MNITKLQEQYRPLLKEAGLKVTPERVSVLQVLEKAKSPLSVKEIKLKLGRSNADKKVDQATIYRTLDALLKNNVVRPVNFQHDHNHYELVDESHHHHLICEGCGKVVDVSKCDTTKLEQEVKTAGGFAKINHHALEFFGLCKPCHNKQKQAT